MWQQKKQNQKLIINLVQNKNITSQILDNQLLNRSLGALFGSFIGDALGATWQFNKKVQFPKKQIQKMSGGGVFDLKPGQVTDDSQLALQLGYALMQFKRNQLTEQQSYLLSKKIALNYKQWFYSEPFDIGNTCGSAFNEISKTDITLKPIQFIKKAINKISLINSQSQSNGSLMRITPMAIFYALNKSKLNKQNLLILIQNQISLTHANPVIKQSSIYWINLLSNLINRKQKQTKTIYRNFLQQVSKSKNQEFKRWIQSQIPNAKENIGWAKIAWTEGIKILRENDQNLNFKEKIVEIISKGGDTDTNACIVGGLMGSILGFKKLPFQYVKQIMNLKFGACCTNFFYKKKKTERDPKYEPKNGIDIVLEMFKNSKSNKNNK